MVARALAVTKAFSLVLAGLTAGVLLAEVTLRVLTGTGTMAEFRSNALPIYDTAADGRPFTLRPNLDYVARFNCGWTLECSMRIKLNDWGLRENRSTAELLAHESKILFMGDSFTFGYGVEQGERYSDLLNTVLNQKATAFSAGYSDGYSPVDYVVYLKTFYETLKPDMVVLGFFPENDLVHEVRARVLTRNERNEIISSKLADGFAVVDGYIARGSESGLTKAFVYGKNWLWEHLAFYRLIEGARNALRYKLHPERQSELLPRALFGEFLDSEKDETETTLGAIKAMDDFLRRRGKTLVVFHIPSPFQVSRYYDRIYDRPGYMVSPDLREKARQVLQPQTMLVRWFQENGIIYIDPTKEFRRREGLGAKLYFDSDGHWTRDGHRAAFEVLSRYLIEHALIPTAYLANRGVGVHTRRSNPVASLS